MVALRIGDHCSSLEDGESQRDEKETVAENNLDPLPWLRKQRHRGPFLATLVRTIFAHLSADEMAAQGAEPEITAFAAFPTEHWRQIRSNSPQERLNWEIRRHGEVVGTFPDRDAIARRIGMVLAEQHEWAVAPLHERRLTGQAQVRDHGRAR